MNFFKSSVIFAFLVGIGISIMFGVKHVGNAQTQNSEAVIGQFPPTTKSPIGRSLGLDELKALFEASEATKAKSIRKVVITIPNEMSEVYQRRVAGNTAIREFFLIADKKSFNHDSDTPMPAPDLTSPQGFKAMLSNGGDISLKLRQENNGKKQSTVGEIRLKNHQISGYEEVTQIEFVGE